VAQNINLNGKEFSWADIVFAFLGRSVEGVVAMKYGVKRERKFIRGVGNKPVAYANGSPDCNGSITVLQSEMEAITAAALAGGYEDLTAIPPFDIIIQYLDASNIMVKDIIKNVLATEWEKASKQGNLNMEVELPFTCSHVILQAK
jgi:hypothetical protein